MKLFLIGLAIIVSILVMVGVLFTEMYDRDRVQQSTIDGLKKQLKTQSDSLQNVLSVTRDSLEIAFETIKIAAKEREEAHLRTQKTIKDLQKIVFIAHTDSSRTKALQSLYKSYTP